MKRKSVLLIINTVLFTCLIVLFILGQRIIYRSAVYDIDAHLPKSLSTKNAAIDMTPVVYRATTKRAVLRKQAESLKYHDIREMLSRGEKNDVGEDVVETWSGASVEIKEEINKTLAKNIERAKMSLKQDPGDPRAKSLLMVSEPLKKMIENNFNFQIDRSDPGKKGIDVR